MVNAILKSSHTGNFGDRKIFIIPIDDLIVFALKKEVKWRFEEG